MRVKRPTSARRFRAFRVTHASSDPGGLNDFSIDFDSKHDHVYFYEWRPDERPLPRVDRREVVAASFVDESDLDARPLSPHVQRYLAWRRER